MRASFISPAPRSTAAAKPAAAAAESAPAETTAPEATSHPAAPSAAIPAASQRKNKTDDAHQCHDHHRRDDQPSEQAGTDADDRRRGQPPEQRSQHASDRDHYRHEQDQIGLDRARLTATTSFLLRRRQRLAVDDSHEAIKPRAQAAIKIALAKFGDEFFLDQAFGGGIRHRAFQSITDFDAHSPVALGNDYDDAVVHALAADLPCLRHTHGK